MGSYQLEGQEVSTRYEVAICGRMYDSGSCHYHEHLVFSVVHIRGDSSQTVTFIGSHTTLFNITRLSGTVIAPCLFPRKPSRLVCCLEVGQVQLTHPGSSCQRIESSVTFTPGGGTLLSLDTHTTHTGTQHK